MCVWVTVYGQLAVVDNYSSTLWFLEVLEQDLDCFVKC